MIFGHKVDTGPFGSLWQDGSPVRGELFGIERLEDHARSLAAAQLVKAKRSKGYPLARRLSENARFLLEANRAIEAVAGGKRRVSPAAEWLIDNYHLVDMQIREIGVDLPAGYYFELPKLVDGPLAGLPRVFGAAWSLVAHTDSHIEPDILQRFLMAYQDVQPLTIGELWAVPITLRIVLIENLRRMAAIIVDNSGARGAADLIADRLLGHDGHVAEPWDDVRPSLVQTEVTDSFAVQFAHRLRGHDRRNDAALAWLDRRLQARQSTSDAAVQAEMQSQGAANATVRNIITSLRLIAAVDWTEAFERVCLANGALAGTGAFLEMDFPTRNLYRSAVEVLARGSSLSELEIARRAAGLAAAATGPEPGRQADTGYYLIAGGRPDFEAAIGFRPTLAARCGRACRSWGIGGYGSAVIVVAALILAAPLWVLHATGFAGWWLAVLGVVGAVPASDAAVACVNRVTMWAFGATPLPELELEAGIPAALRTMVAVPVLLTSERAIAEQIAHLEVHHLASPDGELHFALVSDWIDSSTESADGDAALLAAAADGIAQLNRRYPAPAAGSRFLLLHRCRRWNAGERCWMGWERKRGKLHELNRLLRGATDTSFMAMPDGQELPPDVRYVVTLDADTRLPRDAVRRLVGKMAQPLNAPRIDPANGRVVEGYAVLQPRVTPSLPVSREPTLFQLAFSSVDGIDPYAAAVSDVYQDLFGEGSFAGKGIYDIDAFEAALAGRVPEATLLSHDLLEGIFARAGLASDIEFVEEFPTDYTAAATRQHRWARGDWQLLPWIMPWAARPSDGAAPRGGMSALGRWKMLDNLRRTLSAPATVLALAAGFALPLGPALGWTAFVLATIAAPTLLPVLGDLVRVRNSVTVRSYFHAIARGLRHAAVLFGFLVVLMADQAFLMVDAIARTLFRVFVSRRKLLQWVASAQSSNGPRLSLSGHYRRMAGASMIGVVALAGAAWSQPGVWLLIVPFALLWIASPAIGSWASRHTVGNWRPAASPADTQVLRLTARRTWRYFETFVTPANNMLPPDNFQESPAPVVAQRTSPTNFGLYLLATASAHDFGWIGLTDAVERLEATLATMGRMERFNGHFYNWYDTADLRPLEPKYVSTVDSGNLAGHLITLANTCQEWAEHAPDEALGAAGMDDAGALAALGVDAAFWTDAVQATQRSHRRDLDQTAGACLAARLATLQSKSRAFANEMQFGFLRNDERRLLSIGYLVAEGALDSNCYDLLASEARLASFFAIAKGDIPAQDWFRLGRSVTVVPGGAALVSWSGSMFEYLMPSLVMRSPAGSLLEQTTRLVVQRQIDFGISRAIPWGVSESAYNVRDLEYTYQYSNFGIPGLGFKRGLGADFVVAPYATALASMVDPHAAVTNFAQITLAGGSGRYGFYEALDYTPARVPAGKKVAVVESYMAHHQGMTIVAIADALLNGIIRARFHTEPIIIATELLLQEREARNVTMLFPLPSDQMPSVRIRDVERSGGRRLTTAQSATPVSQLLSNGRYAIMLTAAGSGYSRWQGQAITRWREDPTLDDWGSYIYLRDIESGLIWSAAAQPCGTVPDTYEVMFNEDRVEYTRRDGTLTTTMEVLVSAEEDAEVRRVSISNAGKHARTIDVTSFCELALAPQATDLAHPAFAKLFIETEFLPETGAILATRRRRTPSEPEIWAGHLSIADGDFSVETDRARFIGRGGDVHAPLAVAGDRKLSDTVGTVLDPIFSIRRRVTVAPGAMVRVTFWTMVAASREELVNGIDKHRDHNAFERASGLAWTQAQVQLRHLGIAFDEADLFQRLASHLLFAGPVLRPDSAAIVSGSGAQAALWGQAISGDRPILLLRIADIADLDVARELVLAHEYFRLKKLAVDLVILNDHAASYAQELGGALEALVRSRPTIDARPDAAQGAVFLLRTDLVPVATIALLASVARVVLVSDRGSLSEQLDRAELAVAPARRARAVIDPGKSVPIKPTLEFFNGLGGFAQDGHEYVVVLEPGMATPAPWINVVANPGFGFQAAAEGSGYTWAGNSRENQITPWSNDPVTDRPGEVFYLEDLESHALWCPTASPGRDPRSTYVAHHGRGYSRFDRTAHGIASSLLQYVPVADPIKISRLQLHNKLATTRTLSICAYVEWVLGPTRSATAAFVQTERDGETGALFARNPWSESSGSQVAFLDLRGAQTSWTGDRLDFLGRYGSLAAPRALNGGAALSGSIGAGLDPCGALRTTITLPPGGRAEIVILLGVGDDTAQARALVAQYRGEDLDAVLAAVRQQWDSMLGAVTVKSPDRSMDIMLNGWLLYQTLACRVWARAGFYQASGAYGFRDQLQDGMALVAARPDLVREHLLRAASRQFIEGDVQHWWLPNTGRGVRTRISDDCAWLAYTVAHYVTATGDVSVLDEPVTFLKASVLTAEEHDRFFLPEIAPSAETLFEHCARALDHSLALGAHGLPLMGTGDWNDGMSRVGEGGQGESVWLGWFLHAALEAFLPLAESRDEHTRVDAWRAHMVALPVALEQAWDGDWYRRAYFDDGTPLGTHDRDECRIDAIAQSWAVISGVAPRERTAVAMASLDRWLVRTDDALLLLLDPPFDTSNPDPGYIKGYPPGIRENGGQYSHAAMWSVMAFALMGDGDKAAKLFAMLNPINHSLTPASVARYKVEPYAVVADIYSTAPHVGRGGWSWYTGSAGWMQRVGVETILGVRIDGETLHLDPCIPKDWPSFEVSIAWRSARYVVTVSNPARVNKGVTSIRLDGTSLPALAPLRLTDDGATHAVEVTLGCEEPLNTPD